MPRLSPSSILPATLVSLRFLSRKEKPKRNEFKIFPVLNSVLNLETLNCFKSADVCIRKLSVWISAMTATIIQTHVSRGFLSLSKKPTGQYLKSDHSRFFVHPLKIHSYYHSVIPNCTALSSNRNEWYKFWRWYTSTGWLHECFGHFPKPWVFLYHSFSKIRSFFVFSRKMADILLRWARLIQLVTTTGPVSDVQKQNTTSKTPVKVVTNKQVKLERHLKIWRGF